MVQLRLARGDTIGAFLLSERSRGSVERTRPRLSRNTVYLAYSLLRDGCVLWIVRGDTLRAVRVVSDTSVLLSHARALGRAIRVDADSVARRAEGRWLYDILVAPAAAELSQARDLVVVANGALDGTPFDAMRDRDGRFLVERVAISYAMSVHSSPRWRAPRRVVVVGDPTFDADVFGGLSPLHGADDEARRLQMIYPNARMLLNNAASKDAVTTELRQAETLHFAGHARLVPRNPDLSHLILARSRGGPEANILAAREIVTMHLSRLRLVVLSSCSTAQPSTHRDVAGNGLADAFLGAGVGQVITSDWEVDDEGAVSLMEQMHRGIALGELPAVALRAAQVAAIHDEKNPTSPRIWASFRVLYQ